MRIQTSLMVVLGTLAASANSAVANVADEADRVAYEVRRELPNLTTRQTTQISQQLQNILGVLRGNGGGQPTNAYVCVSRDNDGQDPWVIGARELAQVTRISGTTFSTKPACEAALAAARPIRGSGLVVCVSRDNDGQHPAAMALLTRDHQLSKLERGTAANQTACLAALRDMRILRDGILYCGARDNDGQNPYVQVGQRLDGSRATIGNETYANYDSCRQAL